MEVLSRARLHGAKKLLIPVEGKGWKAMVDSLGSIQTIGFPSHRLESICIKQEKITDSRNKLRRVFVDFVRKLEGQCLDAIWDKILVILNLHHEIPWTQRASDQSSKGRMCEAHVPTQKKKIFDLSIELLLPTL